MVTARVCMMLSLVHGSNAEELLSTGWSLPAMTRLQHGLEPYHEGTDLSSLSAIAVAICDILSQATDNKESKATPAIPDPQSNPFGTSFGSSISTQQPSVFEQPFASSFGSSMGTSNSSLSAPSFATQPFTTPQGLTEDLLEPTDMEVDENSVLDLGAVTGGNFLSAPNFLPGGPQQQGHTNPFFNTTPFGPRQESRKSVKTCRYLVNDQLCRKGPDTCHFSHDPEIVRRAHEEPQAKSAPPQSAFLDISMSDGINASRKDSRPTTKCRDVTKWGSCRRQDCTFFHPPGTHMPGPSSQAKFDSRSTRPCRNEGHGGLCHNSGCAFKHERSNGTSSSNNTATSMPPHGRFNGHAKIPFVQVNGDAPLFRNNTPVVDNGSRAPSAAPTGPSFGGFGGNGSSSSRPTAQTYQPPRGPRTASASLGNNTPPGGSLASRISYAPGHTNTQTPNGPRSNAQPVFGAAKNTPSPLFGAAKNNPSPLFGAAKNNPSPLFGASGRDRGAQLNSSLDEIIQSHRRNNRGSASQQHDPHDVPPAAPRGYGRGGNARRRQT